MECQWASPRCTRCVWGGYCSGYGNITRYGSLIRSIAGEDVRHPASAERPAQAADRHALRYGRGYGRAEIVSWRLIEGFLLYALSETGIVSKEAVLRLRGVMTKSINRLPYSHPPSVPYQVRSWRESWGRRCRGTACLATRSTRAAGWRATDCVSLISD